MASKARLIDYSTINQIFLNWNYNLLRNLNIRESKKNVMVSSTYTSELETLFIMKNIEADSRESRIIEKVEEENKNKNIIKPEISNGWTKNNQYKNLLIDLELDKLDHSVIIEVYINWIYWYQNTIWTSTNLDNKYHLLTNDVDPELKQMIIQSMEKGSNVKIVSELFNVDSIICRSIFNEKKYFNRNYDKI